MRDTATSPAPSPLLTARSGLLALAVAMGIGRFAFTPVMPMMLDDAGLSIAQGSLLASANYAGYLIGAISATMIRIQAGTAIRGGLALIAATTMAMALHLPLQAWLAMRLLAGIASAWVLISVSAWSLDRLARLRRPGLSSMVFAGVGAGIAAAGLACIMLSGAGASSFQAWFALGCLSAVVAAAVWRIFGRQGTAGETAPGAAAGADAGERYRWNAYSIRLVACYGLFGFGYIIPATFLPVMAKQALADPSMFGWSWPIFGLAAALSTLATARLNAFFSSRHLWLGCHLLMAAGVALPAIWSNLATVMAAALLVGGTFMVITLCAMQEARRVAGTHATMLIAAMTSAFALGQIIGPFSISPAHASDGNFGPALMVAAGSLLASALLLMGRAAPATAVRRRQLMHSQQQER